MKTFYFFPLVAAVALVVSCEKPQSEADRNAQIEREVQQRLTAERQADEQKRLAQQQADLAAREKALADKETSCHRGKYRTDRDSAGGDALRRGRPIRGRRLLRPIVRRRVLTTHFIANSNRTAPGARRTITVTSGNRVQAQQSRDWRPYTNGRWAYTDAGWTWVSEEPFGWATYHYGRWTRLRDVGWVWVPGEEWAPAWVSWRSGDNNVGWAPLPPEARFDRGTGIKKWADSYYDISADEYVFIPNEDIGSDRIESAVIPVERNVTIVNADDQRDQHHLQQHHDRVTKGRTSTNCADAAAGLSSGCAWSGTTMFGRMRHRRQSCAVGPSPW